MDKIARLKGFALGGGGIVLALALMSDLPAGAPWLLLISVVYILSVHYASKEYALRNEEEKAGAIAEAEAPPAKAGAATSHH